MAAVVIVTVVGVVDDQQLELLLLGTSLEMRIKHLLRNQRFFSKKNLGGVSSSPKNYPPSKPNPTGSKIKVN